ncbi:AbrB family transcriptional regulator [Phaeobacter sp. PT47_59]|uniref:AbrB family transcriptional regulator n=1 Tax=Phaeobacter sp. PT47_59 TaxID=3029979 RepID=UPI00237FEA31|nr:AbrB family transcriptional regulator [Phaeobacter sp. PT47_59]MDE4176271.1 AbrB family transcriptional regulator [Phaeobacter sp. PT47_59]
MTRALTFAIAIAGALSFLILGLPLPFLLGPMSACLLAALFGARMTGAGQFGFFMRTFLGVAVGASITPELIHHLPDIAISLMFVPLFIASIATVGYPLLRFVFKFNPVTAWYSAMPGGLQDMLIFGEEAGGDPRALSLIHATRVVVLVSIAPVMIAMTYGLDLSAPPGAPIASLPISQIVIMALAGLIGWKLAKRVGLFGASILGPMILTTILSLTGVVQTRRPAEIIQAAQFFIGIAVGVKYVGITRLEVRSNITAGLVYSAVMALVSLVFFKIIVTLELAPSLDALMAFLPGGQAEMVVIAIIAGADLAYVVTHHVLRILTVVLLAPVVARVLNMRK